MAPNDLPYACACGTVQGTASGLTPASGTRCICYCSDCQAFLRHLGQEARLDAWGGTELFQTAPWRLSLTAGADQLRCLRLTEHGVLRWYAACCRTPIANTPPEASHPFAALFTSSMQADAGRLDAALGPVRYRVVAKEARGTPSGHTHAGNSLRHILRTIRFLLQWRITRRGRPTPFFDAQGKPVVPVERVIVRA